MATRRVYIDESGRLNPGSETEKVFVFAAVVVEEGNHEKLVDKVADFRKIKRYKNGDEFKFHKMRKDSILELIHSLKNVKYSVYSVYFDNSKKCHKRKRVENLYLEILKVLLIQIASNNMEITIDGSYGANFSRKAGSYLRKALRGKCKGGISIRFSDSKKNTLIQLADVAAGSISRSFGDKKDAKVYRKAFGCKIKECIEVE